MKRRHKRIAKGVLIGVAGGLVASYVMNQFQTVWSKALEMAKKDEPQSKKKQGEQESDDATMKAADKVSRTVLDHPLSRPEKKSAGPVVHYVFGGAMGALYGAASEIAPDVTRGFGTLFGAALFAVADEIAVPALGLSKSPKKTPISSHVQGLVSHLVYGATTEGVRRTAKALM